MEIQLTRYEFYIKQPSILFLMTISCHESILFHRQNAKNPSPHF